MNLKSNGYQRNHAGSHNTSTGEIKYDSFTYNRTKSFRNRSFMNSFESEFNRGFRPKYAFNNTQRKGDAVAPRRPSSNFKNWNNALARNF